MSSAHCLRLRSASTLCLVSRLGLASFVLLSVLVGVANADLPQIVRVEEDWEMVVATPDPQSDAPQVSTVITPLRHVESIHATFVLNHQSLPSFEPGGIQLKVWDGEVALSDRMYPNGAVLEHAGETIGWTQSMELRDGALWFEITNGSSSTWGSFGGQGYLKASVPMELSSLNTYCPAVSVLNSGVSYAANRVGSLTLKAVRVITSTGEQYEDTTPRPVNIQR